MFRHQKILSLRKTRPQSLLLNRLHEIGAERQKRIRDIRSLRLNDNIIKRTIILTVKCYSTDTFTCNFSNLSILGIKKKISKKRRSEKR